MSKDNLEIERKFLLKKIPHKEMNSLFPEKWNEEGYDLYEIAQYYFLIEGRRKRYRQRLNLSTHERQYFETEKKSLSPGVFEEIEKEITEEDFKKIYHDNKSSGSVIAKNRFAIQLNGLTWEIDNYLNISLITLEVELDDINQEIDIPDFLVDLIIKEVTGDEDFSNFNLSLPMYETAEAEQN